MASLDVPPPGTILVRAFRCRCPHCGRDRLFRGFGRLNIECAACGLMYEREPEDAWFWELAVDGVAAFLCLVAFFPLWGGVGRSSQPWTLMAGMTLFALLNPFRLSVTMALHYWRRAKTDDPGDPIPPVSRRARIALPLFVEVESQVRVFDGLDEAETALVGHCRAGGAPLTAYDAEGRRLDVFTRPRRRPALLRGDGRFWSMVGTDAFDVRIEPFDGVSPGSEAFRALLVTHLRATGVGAGTEQSSLPELVALAGRSVRAEGTRGQGDGSR